MIRHRRRHGRPQVCVCLSVPLSVCLPVRLCLVGLNSSTVLHPYFTAALYAAAAFLLFAEFMQRCK